MTAVWKNTSNSNKNNNKIISGADTIFMVDSEKIFITAFLVKNGDIIARLWNASENEVRCSLRSSIGRHIFVKESPLETNSWQSIENNMFSFRPWGIYMFKVG